MSLSTTAKDYIANHFGATVGTVKCFVSSGISYTDPAGSMQTGSTQDVVATLKMNIGGVARGPGGEVYIDIPDWSSINDADITWIGNSQSGAAQYCVGAVSPTCTPGTRRCRDSNTVEQCRADGTGWEVVQTCGTGYTCQNGVCVLGTAPTRPVTPPFEVIIKEGVQCGPGSPSVLLDTSAAFAYFKATPLLYVGVMDILVNNLNTDGRNCWAYFIWEMRMWDGPAGTTCPTTTPEVQEICRFLGEISPTKVLSIKMLGASENAMIGGSFEIPPHIRGRKTICLSLWGNYDKQALIDELAAAGYAEEIPW